MVKPLLKNPLRTVQPIDFAGIFPTKSKLAFMDIDGIVGNKSYFGVEKRVIFHDWKKHGFIFVEAKYKGAPLSSGEKQGIENFVDLLYDGFCYRHEPQNLVAYFIISHDVEDPTQSIFAADCPVVSWYLPNNYRYIDPKTKEETVGGWGYAQPGINIPFKQYVWQTISIINEANNWKDVTPRFYVNEDCLEEYLESLKSLEENVY